MLDAILFMIILSLMLSLMTALKRIRALQRQLQSAERLLAIQQDIMRHQWRMATGGAFAKFINSLDLSRLDHEQRQNRPGRHIK